MSIKIGLYLCMELVTHLWLSKTRILKAAFGRFFLNGALTRGASGHTFFRQTYPSYMQSFIKIRGAVLEKSGIKIMILCNFNKDFNKDDVRR